MEKEEIQEKKEELKRLEEEKQHLEEQDENELYDECLNSGGEVNIGCCTFDRSDILKYSNE